MEDFVWSHSCKLHVVKERSDGRVTYRCFREMWCGVWDVVSN